jgi:hypothetical protein
MDPRRERFHSAQRPQLPVYVSGTQNRLWYILPQIDLLSQEQWLASQGKTAVTDQLNSWRRDHMSDLAQMFDFAHVNVSRVTIPSLATQHALTARLHDP